MVLFGLLQLWSSYCSLAGQSASTWQRRDKSTLCMTSSCSVVCILSSISQSIADLLVGAAGLIYGYTIVIPVVLFLALKYFGSESANLLECWALYGYSNLIWIPVALISWSPLSILNYIFVGVGFGLSVAFLLRNLYPVLSATDKQTSKILLILVVILHAVLAIFIKVLFFAHGSPARKTPEETKPETGGDSMKFFMF